MVHFVDDRDWEALLVRAAGCVAPGGVLVLADEFSDERMQVQPHVVVRPFSSYIELFNRLGLEFDYELQRRVVEQTRFARSIRIARKPA
jgi:hypothetical protein